MSLSDNILSVLKKKGITSEERCWKKTERRTDWRKISKVQDLEWSKNMRTKKRQMEAEDRKNRTMHDYDWRKLWDDGKLGKLI